MAIIAPFELERFAWGFRDSKISVTPALLLIGLSMHEGWTSGMGLWRELDLPVKPDGPNGRVRRDVNTFEFFAQLGDWARSEIRTTHRKHRCYQLAEGVSLIRDDSADGRLVLKMLQQLKLYRKSYPNGSMLAVGIWYAVYVRRMRRSNDIADYLDLPTTRLMTVYRILNRMADLGMMQLLSKPGGQGAKLLVYPVED